MSQASFISGSTSNLIDDVHKKAEESKQWEFFFDPQYTFGSFQSGITKPITDFYSKRPNVQPSLSQPGSPTLPNLRQLQLHINTLEQNDDTQIKILPRPFPKYNSKQNDNILCKKRLQLLNTIQVTGFNKENDAAQIDPYQKISIAARLQLQFKHKTEQMKREILLDPEDEMDDDFNSIHSDGGAGDSDLLPKDQSSLVSLDSYEKISFRESKEKIQEQEQETKDLEIKRKNRISFLFFAFGFLFPPLWIIGALYVPRNHTHRSVASKEIDKKWKLYSRNAWFFFMALVVFIAILIVILNPEAIGFRQSLEGGYDADRVVFD